jgi:hypothetical protein
MNKKYIPIALVVVGIIAVIGVFVSIGSSNKPTPTATPIAEEIAPEIPFDQRPYVSLTPRSDGHWLKLSIMGVNKVSGSATIDYILEYRTSADVNQGVPGTVQLSGVTNIDRDLLLGSESSGKFRYDDGVTMGSLTLRFRDKSGKLLGKLSTDFHLQDFKSTSITSADNTFTYTLDKAPKKGYFVTLNTMGVPEGVKGEVAEGPYGVFTSETTPFPGKVTLSGTTVYRWGESKWNTLKGGASSDLGVFVSTK